MAIDPYKATEKESGNESADSQFMNTDTKKRKISKKFLIFVLIFVLAGVSIVWFFVYKADQKNIENPIVIDQSVKMKKDDTDSDAPAKEYSKETVKNVAIDCLPSMVVYSDKTIGLAFCYPIEWGAVIVKDAKVDVADTGYRQQLVFSDNPYFSVGGASDDWSTEVGRGVGCLEPNNTPAELSTYDTDWHDIIGVGADIESATRSLTSSGGGYDMVESVGDYLSGVCVQGHKAISGSRYRVAFAAFYRELSVSSGINTPKAHIDAPNILFTATQRTQYDALLASLVAY